MEWTINSRATLEGVRPEGTVPERRVLLSPDLGSATHLAAGLSVFGPHAVAEEHRHPAEEVGYVISGSGVHTVGGVSEHVDPGTITHVPPGFVHETIAGPDGIVLLWVYAPTGSERRWIADLGNESANV